MRFPSYGFRLMHRITRRAFRTALLAALTVILLASLTPRLADRFLSLPDHDFVEYWSAGRLLISGGNPYSPAEVLAVERSQGWKEPYPVMMYNPPWCLPLVFPLGALSFRSARLLWLGIQLASILASAIGLAALYAGKRHSPLPIVLALSFFPSLLVLRTGQISALMLLGLSGFLINARRRPFVAGVWVALVAAKPQLVFLLWPALLLWSVHRRSWRMLLGLSCAIGSASVVALVLDRSAFVQFVHLVANRPPDYVTPTIGTVLRLVFGPSRYGLQFLSCLVGFLWLLQFWRARRAAWAWAEHTPLLILVSLVTAPYGWPYDVVVALPALMVAGLNARAPLPIAAYVAVDLLAMGLNLAGVDAAWYVWFAPALLGCYWWATRIRSGHSQLSSYTRA